MTQVEIQKIEDSLTEVLGKMDTMNIRMIRLEIQADAAAEQRRNIIRACWTFAGGAGLWFVTTILPKVFGWIGGNL
jgi:hypothetical protein